MSVNRLRMFLYTVDVYKQLVNYDNRKVKYHNLLDECTDAEYRKIQIKLTLLRKYVSDNTKEIHLKNILNYIKADYPEKKIEVQPFYSRLKSLSNSEIKTFLSNGEELDLRKVFELEAYGLIIHADIDKFEKLINLDERILRMNVRKYVEDCENLVLDIASLVENLDIPELVIAEKERAEVVSVYNPQNLKQEVRESPYWSNLIGRDAKKGEAFEELQKLDEESQAAVLTAVLFIDLLQKEVLNISKLRGMVATDTLKKWGDFTEAQKFIKSWTNEGINLQVRYSDTHNVAHIRIFEHVDSEFILQSHQMIESYIITLVKSPNRQQWLVYDFTNNLEEQMSLSEYLKLMKSKIKSRWGKVKDDICGRV